LSHAAFALATSKGVTLLDLLEVAGDLASRDSLDSLDPLSSSSSLGDSSGDSSEEDSVLDSVLDSDSDLALSLLRSRTFLDFLLDGFFFFLGVAPDSGPGLYLGGCLGGSDSITPSEIFYVVVLAKLLRARTFPYSSAARTRFPLITLAANNCVRKHLLQRLSAAAAA
jgi:hypothetical protein